MRVAIVICGFFCVACEAEQVPPQASGVPQARTGSQGDPLRGLLHAPAGEWLQQDERSQSLLVSMVAEGVLTQADPDRRILPDERRTLEADVSRCTSLAISRDRNWGDREVADYMAECFTAAGIPMTSG